MNPELLTAFSRPHGCIVRDDVVPSVVSLSTWYRLHATGWLVALHPGVARPARIVETALMRVEAAVAASVPGSSVAGLTAAWLWGAGSGPGEEIELLAPPYRNPGRLTGVRIHRPTDRPYPVARLHRHLPTCDPLRATLDVAAWHPDLVLAVLSEFLERRRYGIEAIRRTLALASAGFIR